METPTLAVLGGNGFLGSYLIEYFSKLDFAVTGITRENYNDYTDSHFDILINANGNSKRFWANQNPALDFEASVISVKNSIEKFRFEKYVFISSSDVYPNHGEPERTTETEVINESKLEAYGLHKYQAEQLVKALPEFLIFRCSAMIGKNLRKGVIKDILDSKNVFVTLDSYLQCIPCSEIARSIAHFLGSTLTNDMYNCGGQGSVKVSEIMHILGTQVGIQSDAQKQAYEMDVRKLHNLVQLKSSTEYLQAFAETIK